MPTTTSGHQDFEPTPNLCYAHATDGEGNHYFCMSSPGHAEEHVPTKWKGKICKYCGKPIYGFDYKMCGIMADGGSEYLHFNPCPVDEVPEGRIYYEEAKARIHASFHRLLTADAPLPAIFESPSEESSDDALPNGQ